MQGKSHLFIGTVSCAAMATMLPLSAMQMGVLAGGCMLGSVFPDIDVDTSTVGRQVKPISTIINQVFGHRGFFHSPCFLLIQVVLFVMLHRFFTIPMLVSWGCYGFFLGQFIHYLADTLTIKGIPWLYPIKKNTYHLLPIKTGSALEPLIALGLVVLVSGLFYLGVKSFGYSIFLLL